MKRNPSASRVRSPQDDDPDRIVSAPGGYISATQTSSARGIRATGRSARASVRAVREQQGDSAQPKYGFAFFKKVTLPEM